MEQKFDISTYLEKYLFNAEEVSKSLVGNEELIKDFVDYAFSDSKDAWRASWILNVYSRNNAEDLNKYADKIIKNIKTIKKDGHIRETLKILLNLNLNEEQTSEVFDYSLSLLEDNKLQPSVRSIAMQYLLKTAEIYPELKQEILIIFENIKDFLSHGVKHSMLIRLNKNN